MTDNSNWFGLEGPLVLAQEIERILPVKGSTPLAILYTSTLTSSKMPSTKDVKAVQKERIAWPGMDAHLHPSLPSEMWIKPARNVVRARLSTI